MAGDPFLKEAAESLFGDVNPIADRIRGNLQATWKDDPDQQAEALKLAQKAGVPPDFAKRQAEELRRESILRDLDPLGIATKSPSTARLLSDPDLAPALKDDTDALAANEQAVRKLAGEPDVGPEGWRGRWQDLQRGTIGFGQAYAIQEATKYAGALKTLADIEDALQSGADPAAAYEAGRKAYGQAVEAYGGPFISALQGGRVDERGQILDDVRKKLASELGKVSRRRAAMKALPASAARQEADQAETTWDWLRAIKKRPVETATSYAVESLPVSLPAILLGALTGGAGGGLAGGALAQGTASAGMDALFGFADALEARGVNLDDPKALQAALSDPNIVAEAQRQAAKHAAVVGTFDAASFAVAGAGLTRKAGKVAAKNLLRQPGVARQLGQRIVEGAKEVAVQTPIQGAAGGLGEGGGLWLSGQKLSPAEIGAEILGEAGGTIFEVPGATFAAGRDATKTVFRAQEATRFREALAEVSQTSAATKTRERLPDHHKQFIDDIASEGGGSVWIDRDRFDELFQGANTDPEEAAAELGLSDQYEEGKESGAPLRLSLGTVTDKIVGTALEESFLDNAKPAPDGLSARQARAWADQNAAAWAEAFGREEGEPKDPTVYDRIRDDLESRQMASGKFGPEEAKLNAEHTATFLARLLSRHPNIDPWKVYERRRPVILGESAENLAQKSTVDELDAMVEGLRKQAKQGTIEGLGPSLVEYLEQLGGVQDTGGELRAMDAQTRRGLVRKKGAGKGLDPDKAMLSAWKAGYFPEFAERPTPNDLFEAVSAELAGQKRYAKAEAAEAQMAVLRQIEDVLKGAGLDLMTSPREEIKQALQTALDQEEPTARPEPLVYSGYDLPTETADDVSAAEPEDGGDGLPPRGTAGAVREADAVSGERGRKRAGDARQLDLDFSRPTVLPSTPVATASQVRGNFAVSVGLETVRTVAVPDTPVLSVHDAARILAPVVRDRAQENYLTLVLDAAGKPLAILRTSIGTKSSALIDPVPVLGGALSIPGAAQVYLAHNHPSGSLIFSDEDRELGARMDELARGSGLTLRGHMAVGADGGYVALSERGGIESVPSGAIQQVDAALAVGPTVDVQERVFVARDIASRWSVRSSADSLVHLGQETGVLLMDTQNRPLGFLALDEAEMRQLRGRTAESPLGRLLRAANDSNAYSAIVRYRSSEPAWRNLAAALAGAGLRLLDAIDEGNISQSDTGAVSFGVEYEPGMMRPFFQEAPDPASEAFRRWFRESQVVDAEGKPLAVYHGTFEDIEKFKKTKGAHLGFHFGTADAAMDRMDAVGGKRGKGRIDPGAFNAKAEALLRERDSIDAALRARAELPEDFDAQLIAALEAGNEQESQRLLGLTRAEPTPEEAQRLADIAAELSRLGAAHLEAISGRGQEGANVLPVYLSIQNPLRAKDAGNWASAKAVREATGFYGKTIAEIKQKIKAAGYDGIVYRNVVEDRILENDSYIAFEPTQIKSVFNRGTFDPEDARILYQEKPAETFAQVQRALRLDRPVKGPSGAEIVGYEWRSHLVEEWSERKQDVVTRRRSDWDQKETSQGTGRDIVHVFYVRRPDGSLSAEGIQSAQKILGLPQKNLLTVAKKAQAEQESRRRADASTLRDLEAAAKPTAAEAARQYRIANSSPMRSEAENDAIFYRSILFEKDGKFIRTGSSNSAELLEASEWARRPNPWDQGPLFQEAAPAIQRTARGRTYRATPRLASYLTRRFLGADRLTEPEQEGAAYGEDGLPENYDWASAEENVASIWRSYAEQRPKGTPQEMGAYVRRNLEAQATQLLDLGLTEEDLALSDEALGTKYRNAENARIDQELAQTIRDELQSSEAFPAERLQGTPDRDLLILAQIASQQAEERIRVAQERQTGEGEQEVSRMREWVAEQRRLAEEAVRQETQSAFTRLAQEYRNATQGAETPADVVEERRRIVGEARRLLQESGDALLPQPVAAELSDAEVVEALGMAVPPEVADSPKTLTLFEVPDTGDFRKDTTQYLTEVLPQRFKVYRSLWLAEGETPDLSAPGEYWAETPEGARRSGYPPESGKFRQVLLEADAQRDQIDVQASISRRARYGEPEIVFSRQPEGARVYGQTAAAARGEGLRRIRDVLFQAQPAAPGPVWTSKLRDTLEAKMGGKMPAEQLRKMLLAAGIKPEEMKWSGFDDLKGVVTKEEALKVFDSNRVELEEVWKGGETQLKARQEQLQQARREALGTFRQDGDRIRTLIYQRTGTDTDSETTNTIMRELAYGDARRRRSLSNQFGEEMDALLEDYDRSEAALEAATEDLAEFDANEGSIRDAEGTKFSTYKLDGGENYREVLFRLPNKNATFEEWLAATGRDADWESGDFDARANLRTQYAESKTPSYRSSHWDEPNVLAHARLQDFTDADGKRVLFVEEVQSDWAQEGRRKGFLNQEPALREARDAALKAYNDTLREETRLSKDPAITEEQLREFEVSVRRPANERLREANRRWNEVASGVPEAPLVSKTLQADLVKGQDGTYSVTYGKEPDPARPGKERASVVATGLTLQEAQSIKADFDARGKIVSDTEGWTTMVARRLLRYAAENGYQRIAWTTGEIQADRYDLSKQISKIEYQDNSAMGAKRATMEGDPSNGKLLAWDLNGRKVLDERITDPAKVEDFIGKEAAKKLFEANPRRGRDGTGWENRTRELSGLDLKVGGEGMVGFYDRIVPDVFAKIGKKWGAKVGTTRLSSDQWSVSNKSGELTGRFETKQEALDRAAAMTARWEEGIRRDGPFAARLRPGITVHSLPIPDAMREEVVAKGFPLFAAGKDKGEPPRASIQFTDAGAVMRFFAGKDLSSFAHESAHLGFRIFRDLAEEAGAPPDLQADWQKLLDWVGAEKGVALTVEQEEKLAKGWERYLMEGRAPSDTLAPMFQRFRAWLASVYRDAQKYAAYFAGVELTDDVRRVFDRLLATEEEIAAAEKRLGLGLSEDLAKFLTPKERAAYAERAARERSAAEDRLLRKALGEIRRERRRWWKEEEGRVRDDVNAELDAEPVYRALAWLSEGKWIGPGEAPEGMPKFRLSLEALTEGWGEGAAALLPRSVPPIAMTEESAKKAGLTAVHPDLMADLFGFGSGDELVRALWNVTPRAGRVKAEVKRRMIAAHGDMLQDGRIEDEAVKAVHGGDDIESLAAYELRTMRAALKERVARRKLREDIRKLREKHRGDTQTLRAEIRKRSDEYRALKRNLATRIPADDLKRLKRYAQDVIARKSVYEAQQSRHYLAAETKAAREVVAHLKRGEYEEAIDAKRRQVLNGMLYKEAERVRGEVEGIRKYLARFEGMQPGSPRRGGGIPPDYLDRIHQLLEKFDLKRRTVRTLERRESFKEWVRQMEEAGRYVLSTPELERLLEESETIHFSTLPLDEFRALKDTVKSIEHQGRFKGRLLKNRDKREFGAIIEELVTSILGRNETRDVSKNYSPNFTEWLREQAEKGYLEQAKIEFLVRRLDGWKDLGPAFNAIFRPTADGQGVEADRLSAVSKRLAELFDLYGVMERSRFAGRFAARTYVPEVGWSMTKGEILSVALNYGSEENRKALLQSRWKDGTTWDEDQVDAVLRKLDARDWQFVQGVWDLMATLYPDLNRLNLQLTGVPLKPKTPVPVILDGKVVAARGGYYPQVYDEANSEKAQKNAEKDQAKSLFENHYTKPVPRHSSRERLVGSGGLPVRLDLQVINDHFQSAIHDIAYTEVVLDVDRIITDSRFEGAMVDTVGREAYRLLRPWLQSIANERHEPLVHYEKILSHLRQGVTIAAMGWKVSTGVAQVLGFTQSLDVLGPKYLIRGLRAVNGIGGLSPERLSAVGRVAFEKSAELRYRRGTFDRDVRDLLKGLGARGPIQKLEHTFLQFASTMDLLVAVPTWQGAYEQGLDRGMSEEDAVAHADSVLRRSQSGGGIKDLALIQRGSPVRKLFTAFFSYFAGTFNLMAERTQQVRTGNISPAKYLGSLTALWFAPAVFGALISRRGPDEDDEWWKWATKEVALYGFQTMVGVRDVARFVIERGGKGTMSVSPAVDAATDIGKALVALSDAAPWSEEEVTEPDIRSMVNAIGPVFHLPTRQAWITAHGIYDLSRGEEDASLLDIFLSRPPKK